MIILALFLQVDSLSLNQAIDLTLKNSPAYYQSKISHEKSRILFYQTLSSFLPTVSTTGSYTKSEYKGTTTSRYSGSMNFSIPVFDLDIIGSIFASHQNLKGSNIQYQSEISNLILRLKTAYYNLINAKELLNASEIAIKRAGENLNLIETKFNLGSASKLELLQAQVFHLRALQDKSRARTAEITAQEELKSILDINNEIYPTDTLAIPDSTRLPPLDSLLMILAKVSYNIRLAQALKNVARINLISSYLSFLPRVSLFYGYSFSSDSFIFNFQYYQDHSTKNYGINISFPIFEIKTLIFKWLNAKKDNQLKEIAKRQVTLETEKLLKTTYYALQESYDKLRLAQKSLAAATEATTIAKEQYSLGAISLLDFLKAEQDVYDVKVTYNEAISDFYIKQANFSYLLGELFLNKEKK